MKSLSFYLFVWRMDKGQCALLLFHNYFELFCIQSFRMQAISAFLPKRGWDRKKNETPNTTEMKPCWLLWVEKRDYERTYEKWCANETVEFIIDVYISC